MIRGEKVRLRAFEASDVAAVHRFKNDSAVAAGLLDAAFPQSLMRVEEWVARASDLRAGLEDYRFVIEADDKPIGFVGLYQTDWISRNAEVGIAIGEADYRGRGMGTDALKVAVRFGFESLGLARIWTRVLADNERSLRMFQRAGFQYEGLMRAHRFRHGRFVDVVMLGRLAPGLAAEEPATQGDA